MSHLIRGVAVFGVVVSASLVLGGARSTPGDDCSGGIIYDAGVLGAAQGYPGATTEVVIVQQFTPDEYPLVIDAVCVRFTDIQLPGDAPLRDIAYEIVMFDDDGSGGQPGTELASLADTAIAVPVFDGRFYSTEVGGVFPLVTEGTAYVGVRWNPSLYHNILVNEDDGIQQVTRYVSKDGGAWEDPFIINNVWGIRLRAVDVVEPDPSPGAILTPDAFELVSGLRLWLRGDDLTATHTPAYEVPLWPDGSGWQHDAVAFGGGRVNPLFDLADVPAVLFRQSPVDELMRANTLLGGALPTSLTVATVYATTGTANNLRPVGFGAWQYGTQADNFNLACDPSIRKDNGSIIGYTSAHPADYFLRMAMMDSSAGTVEDFFDGVQALSSTENFTVSTDDFYLGDLRTSDTEDDIRVAETIVYDRSLTTAEREGIEGYVTAKYRSRMYLRFEEGVALRRTAHHLDHSFNDNDGYPQSLTANLPSASADVPVATVPLTRSANGLSLDLESDDGQYVEVIDAGSLLLASDLTIEAWVRLETLSSGGGSSADRRYLVWKGADDGGFYEVNYGLLVQAGDLFEGATIGSGTDQSLVFLLGDGTHDEVVISALEITDTEWHHVSAAYERDAGTVRFTLDGQVDTVSGLTVTMTPNAGNLLIGAYRQNGSTAHPAFDGLVDELRISGYATPAEMLLDRGGLIFLDGFDAGDSSAWSATIP